MNFVSIVFLFIFILFSTAQAASLRVSPVIIDLVAPSMASSIRVKNDDKQAINVQARIFRWYQKNGADFFESAPSVAVSPPMMALKPGVDNIIRIVRTSKAPVKGEESYRLIVDELPRAGNRSSTAVTLVVRHSIPVFFAAPETRDADPVWSVRHKQGGYEVSVVNKGGTRLRVSNLDLKNAAGVSIARREGLVGYVLGQSSATWLVPAIRGKSGSGTITIVAQSEKGPINARVRINGG